MFSIPEFSIADIFYLVFSQLAVGGMAVMLFIPTGLVGANFYRLMGGIYLLVSGLARCTNLFLREQPVNIGNFFVYWQGTEAILVISFVTILCVYTLSWWFKSAIVTQILFYACMLCGIFWLIYSALPYLDNVQFPGATVLLPLQFLVSAVLLGTVHTGMWFGHWYLVTPELPVHYLRRYNTLLLGTLILAFTLFCSNLIFRSQVEGVEPFNFHYNLIFFMRAGIGFVGTLILYFITWDCLRPKSVAIDEVGATRAATGFLFIAIITVLMGEFCSRYLFLAMHFLL